MFNLHLRGDLVFYALFLLGQAFYIFKRAAMAIRSTTNPIQSRTEFIRLNWDIFLIRAIAEFILVYYPWRHISLAEMGREFSIHWMQWLGGIPAASSPLTAFALGFLADGIVDWASQSTSLPEKLRKLIAESIPPVSHRVVAVVKTETTVTPVSEHEKTTKVVTVQPVTAPEAAVEDAPKKHKNKHTGEE